MLRRAVVDAFTKLDPRRMVRNPVMFVVEVGSVVATALWVQALAGRGEAPAAFIGGITLWLWFTVLFANFSEALAEGRGKARAEALRRTRQETPARKVTASAATAVECPRSYEEVPSTALRQGDLFLAH
jgi:K+-transporting ATPase ATPase B chain